MEYVPGGDMMQLLINMGIFTESLARWESLEERRYIQREMFSSPRFYIAELVLAVEYVHSVYQLWEQGKE